MPTRNRKKGPARNDTAYTRACQLMGEDVVKKMRSDWDSWETGRGGREWQQSEGVVLQLLQHGFSERVIKAVIPVGGSRIARLRAVIKEGIDVMHTRRVPMAPSHAFSDVDKAAFLKTCEGWELEDGFPCSHRRPRQYFIEQKLTLLKLHARYKDAILKTDSTGRVLSYSRYTQYFHFHFPGLRLTRSKEDVCDCCVRLDIQLSRDDLSDEERIAIKLEKGTHLNAAVAQRRFISTFVREYVKLHAPDQDIVIDVIPDMLNDDPPPEPIVPGANHVRIQIQAEDYGGGIAMPHFGHTRPSCDYYNSNLIIQNFVVADITNKRNNVYFYDERAQDKGADALCSLRLLYHLTRLLEDVGAGVTPAEISLSLLDNCVGQNKSKVLFMFFALLSIVFPYKKVVLCFLLPGHSHNIADRVVAWCRAATRGMNIYTPMALVDAVNKVNSVNGIFLDHTDPARPFFVDWDTLLHKYFTVPPSGYTSNYLFEIDQGICTARHLVTTPDSDAITFNMVKPGTHDAVRKAILTDLFGPGVTQISQASIGKMQLPRCPVKTMADKKLKSLSEKYFSIPPECLGYYPKVSESVMAPVNVPVTRKRNEIVSAVGVPEPTEVVQEQPAKRGRPAKKHKMIESNQPSILKFFAMKQPSPASMTKTTSSATPPLPAGARSFELPDDWEGMNKLYHAYNCEPKSERPPDSVRAKCIEHLQAWIDKGPATRMGVVIAQHHIDRLTVSK